MFSDVLSFDTFLLRCNPCSGKSTKLEQKISNWQIIDHVRRFPIQRGRFPYVRLLLAAGMFILSLGEIWRIKGDAITAGITEPKRDRIIGGHTDVYEER